MDASPARSASSSHSTRKPLREVVSHTRITRVMALGPCQPLSAGTGPSRLGRQDDLCDRKALCRAMTRHDHQCPRRKGSPEEVAFNAPLPGPVLKHKAAITGGIVFADGVSKTGIVPQRNLDCDLAAPCWQARPRSAAECFWLSRRRKGTLPSPSHDRFVGTNGRFCGIRHSFFDELSLSVPMLLKLFFLE